MTLHRPPVSLLALVAIALATATSPASAETTLCTAITSLPYTISASGVYCLTADLATSMSSGAAITIDANSVTLDLNGHKLGGAGAGVGTTADGIYALNHRNVVVRNGNIRGFMRAVYLADNTAYASTVSGIIEDITAESNRYAAIRVECTGCIVRRNLVVDSGGTTAFGPNAVGVAISAFGTGNVIRDNDISTVTGTGNASGYGVFVNPSHNTVIEGNRISNTAYGAYAGGSNILFSDNRLTNMSFGIYYTGTGKYRNNLTAGVTTLAIGGTDAGGNN